MSPPSRRASRVVIVGSSCAGKTTFAQALAQARSCICVDLDDLFWGPDWTPQPLAEFLQSVAQSAAGDTWVAAGNYGTARDILWSRATTVVWLNFSLPRVLWRGVRRTVKRVVSRQELFQGNRESFRRAFLSRESILWWIVSTHRRRRQEFERLRASGHFPQIEWMEARNPTEAAAILQALQQGPSGDAPF